MYLRYESANLTLPLSEMELPKEMEALSVATSRPAAWTMVGHRPVLHCDAGVTMLPPSDHSYPGWLEEELLDLKLVGA